MDSKNGVEVTLASGKKLISSSVYLTFNYLNSHLLYDPETGTLTWKKAIKHRQHLVGKQVGSLDNKGYRLFKINGRVYYTHRVIWFLYYGEWPKIIDHINHNRGDNRIENLRSVSYGENQLNRKENRPSKTGVPGIYERSSGSFAVFSLGKRRTGSAYLGTCYSKKAALELQTVGKLSAEVK